MDPTRLLTQTCTVTHRTQHASSTDEMGDPTVVETTATYKCWLSQEQRSEQTINTDVQRERWALYVEPAASGLVDGGDKVTVAAIVYEVDGPPWAAHNPRTSIVTHLEMSVQRST